MKTSRGKLFECVFSLPYKNVNEMTTVIAKCPINMFLVRNHNWSDEFIYHLTKECRGQIPDEYE